jgi:hypothetical protein
LTAGVLVIGEHGRLVAVGRLEAGDEIARSDGPDGAGCPPLQAVVTSTTTASIAKQRIGLICSGYGAAWLQARGAKHAKELLPG